MQSPAPVTNGTIQAVPIAATTDIATIVLLEAASVTVALRWFVAKHLPVTSGATSSVRTDVLEVLVTPVSLADGVVPPAKHKSVVEPLGPTSG